MATVNPGDTGYATSTVHAATINHNSGFITTESLSTADAMTVYTFTITDNDIQANSVLAVTVGFGTCTTGLPMLSTVTPAAGSAVVKIANASASAAFNGTLVIGYAIVG